MDLQKIEDVIAPLIQSQGMSLYDLAFEGRVLRVSITKEGGVAINDCAEISRLLNPVLDVEELIPGGRYELEVSSPGLDRSLKKQSHYEGAVGEIIHVFTDSAFSNWNQKINEDDKFFENRKKMKGELLGIKEDVIELSADGRIARVPIKNITKAYVDFEIQKQPKKGR